MILSYKHKKMSDPNHPTAPNIDPTAHYAELRANLDAVLANIASYEPTADGTSIIPSVSGVDRNIHALVSRSEHVPTDILRDYTTALKFEEDALSQYGNREPNYWSKLEQIGAIDAANLRDLYESGDDTNPLREMLDYQVSRKLDSSSFLVPALDIVKKVHGTETIPELIHSSPDDPTLATLTDALRSGNTSTYDLYSADTRGRLEAGTQARRSWMRDAVRIATSIAEPEQADAYIYSMNRSGMGQYNLDVLVQRINSYGSDKLLAIKEFAGNSALSSYSDRQLDRLYKLSQGDQEEIERLKGHDVIAAFVNMDGDHNGVSLDVMERLDDDGERLIPFEVTHPEQIYGYLKKLHDLGILPSTLIFASHGSEGQYIIAERPPMDSSDDFMMHVTTVIDQELADHISAQEENLKGYDVANANGLIRAIQRFMQPSRAIDDPEKDLGRKKVISLSCQFDGTANRASLGPDGEKVRGEKTTLLRRLGEVIVDKLRGEHIDIYGADISTNQQTRTARGFHYNQNRNGRRQPYAASVLHVDDTNMQWHKLNEVQLRKVA